MIVGVNGATLASCSSQDDKAANGGDAATNDGSSGGEGISNAGGSSLGSGGTANTGGSPSGGGVLSTGATVNTGGGTTTATDAAVGGDAGSASAEVHDCQNPGWDPNQFTTVHDVGPGQMFATPSEVPWESIQAGTLVRIHPGSQPYNDKWVISASGTADQPVVVLGVPDSSGKLPQIRGDQANTRSALDFWNEDRGIVKIGGSNMPADAAAFVTLQCLDIASARPGISFHASDGTVVEYQSNAACVYLESGEHLDIRNNTIHGCGNGIFISNGSSEVTIAANYIYDNGNPGSAYEHNSYTEASHITFEFNHYGPLCDGCDGNNLKDRSSGTVIRYNWIESGNRQLDLVESDFDELINDPAYRRTVVYGNVLIEPDGAGNSQIVHYGGDGGDTSKYRKGYLYFFHNTVVSTRSGNTTLLRLSSEEESASVLNSVISVAAAGNTLAISAGMGAAALEGNWLPQGWVDTHDTLTGTVTSSTNVEGDQPGFVDAALQNFELDKGSTCINAASALPAALADHPVLFEYDAPQSARARPMDDMPDIGAYETN